MRLDQFLFNEGHAASRERAKALIMAGVVYINGVKADKAGQEVTPEASVEVRGRDIPYVSRGGLKLEKALQVFPLSVRSKVCMDIGASTGGFTDCLLQNGAARVYAVDVGYGQLAWKLRCDERVVVLERTNVRHLQPETIPEPILFFTADVSFISLRHIFPVMAELGSDDCEAVCLVKPQFEAGRDKVGKKGVVREPTVWAEVLQKATENALQNGFIPTGLDHSPIKGPEGNVEFLLYLKKGRMENTPDFAPFIHRVTSDAAQALQ